MDQHNTASLPKRPVGPDVDRLDVRFPGKYLSLTSFKRDGTGVATTVWFVIDGGRLLIQTDPGSFKAKRIRRNPAVEVAPCSASGRLRGARVPARAEFLHASETDPTKRLMERKYRLDRVLIVPLYRAVQRLRGTPAGNSSVTLAITPLPTTIRPRGWAHAAAQRH